MKTLKTLLVAILIPLLFSCEKECNFSEEYIVKITSSVEGKLVANTPFLTEVSVNKGVTVVRFQRSEEQDVSFTFYLRDRCPEGEVKMELFAAGKTSSISNRSDSYIIAIEGSY